MFIRVLIFFLIVTMNACSRPELRPVADKAVPVADKVAPEPLLSKVIFKDDRSKWFFEDLIIQEQSRAIDHQKKAIELGHASSAQDFINKLTYVCFEIDCEQKLSLLPLLKNIEITNQYGKGLLFLATLYYDYELVKELLRRGASPFIENRSYSPLLLSIRMEDWNIYNLLAQQFPNLELLFGERLDKWTTGVAPSDVSPLLHRVSRNYGAGTYGDYGVPYHTGRDSSFVGISDLYLAYRYAYFFRHSKSHMHSLGEKEVPALVNFGFSVEGFSERNLDRTLYFYSSPTRNSKIVRTIKFNPSEITDQEFRLFNPPDKFLNKYFYDDKEIRRRDFNDIVLSGTLYNRGVHYVYEIIVYDVEGNWCKVRFRDLSYGWIHRSQAYLLVINDHFWETSRGHFVAKSHTLRKGQDVHLKFHGESLRRFETGQLDMDSVSVALWYDNFSENESRRLGESRDFTFDGRNMIIRGTRLKPGRNNISILFTDSNKRKGRSDIVITVN